MDRWLIEGSASVWLPAAGWPPGRSPGAGTGSLGGWEHRRRRNRKRREAAEVESLTKLGARAAACREGALSHRSLLMRSLCAVRPSAIGWGPMNMRQAGSSTAVAAGADTFAVRPRQACYWRAVWSAGGGAARGLGSLSGPGISPPLGVSLDAESEGTHTYQPILCGAHNRIARGKEGCSANLGSQHGSSIARYTPPDGRPATARLRELAGRWRPTRLSVDQEPETTPHRRGTGRAHPRSIERRRSPSHPAVLTPRG